MEEGEDPTALVTEFEKFNNNMLDRYFPMKTITITQRDKPWMKEHLKVLRRQKQRVYEKEGKSQRYMNLQKEFKMKKNKEIKKEREKTLSLLKDKRINSAYRALCNLGAEEEDRDFFTISALDD